MPKIGRRILKSSLAVFLCFVIYMMRGQKGVVFYSCIAAVLCIQQDVTNSKRVGFNRIKGTLLGGFIGMLVLLFEQSFINNDYLILQYIIISLTIIIIIYSSVLLHMTSASYISCVVFLSITVSHAMDVNPYVFAINRMIDTLIGIFVALLINGVHLPNHHHDHTLFACNLENALGDEEGKLSTYTKVKLKQLIERNANIVLLTQDTPPHVISKIKDIPIELPLIAMRGACSYDLVKQEYISTQTIDAKGVQKIVALFQAAHVNCFVHTLAYQILHVYYQSLDNPMEEAYYHQMRKIPYQNYICQNVPATKEALMILAIARKDRLIKLAQQLQNDEYLQVFLEEAMEYEDYAIIKIYSVQASEKTMLANLMKENAYDTLYVFGSKNNDQELLEMAKQCFMTAKHKLSLSNVAYIKENVEDGIVRKMEQLHHHHRKY